MDVVKKYLVHKGKASIIVADTTELVEYVKNLHDLTPTTTAAMGRFVTISGIMGLTEIKEKDDLITVQMNGRGPAGTLVSVIKFEDNISKVKAYISEPHTELPIREDGKIDVGGAIGNNGYLNIIRKNNVTDSNYSGLVPLVSGEIAEDFAEYFVKSMQKPTVLALGVLVNKDGVKKAGGFLLNLMPDAEEDVIVKIEDALSKAPAISKMLDDDESLENIVKIVSGDENPELIEDSLKIEYECDCSRDKFEQGLISIGKEELEKIIKEDGKASIRCQFCNKEYNFTKEELDALLEEAK